MDSPEKIVDVTPKDPSDAEKAKLVEAFLNGPAREEVKAIADKYWQEYMDTLIYGGPYKRDSQ